MRKDIGKLVAKGSMWGAAFVASLAMTAYCVVGAIEDVTNTEYQDIQDACVNEYMTSDDFIARAEAKQQELFDSLKNGKITSEEFTYEYSELFDKKDAMMILSQSDTELGLRYQEAMKAENNETRDIILRAFGLAFGIVASACSSAQIVAYGHTIKNELGSVYAYSSASSNNSTRPRVSCEYSNPEDAKAREEAEKEEKDFESYVKNNHYIPYNIESDNPMTIQAMHELREEFRRESMEEEYMNNENQK